MQVNDCFEIIHAPTDASPFAVVYKPSGMPCAPLRPGEFSALTRAARIFPEILSVVGKKEIECGLVHRIDTETSGLVLIAATQESYDALSESQNSGLFVKWYSAEVDCMPECTELLSGFPENKYIGPRKAASEHADFFVESSFRMFGPERREVRPVTDCSGRAAKKKCCGKTYRTHIHLSGGTKAECRITAGFRHQVRCHLAWCGFPVRGDALYNPSEKSRSIPPYPGRMSFRADRISFPHPLTGIPQVFEI